MPMHNHFSPAIAQVILSQYKVACVLCDSDLQVMGVEGDLSVFPALHAPVVGHSLLEVALELVGMEADLTALCSGSLARLDIPTLNREGSDGTTVYVDVTVLPYMVDGACVGVLYIATDVTAVGELEQRLTQQRNEVDLLRTKTAAQNVQLTVLNAELRRLDQAKTNFVNAAAHELRTPLTSIVGFSELLQDGNTHSLSPQQRQCVDLIQRGAERLITLTTNMLDIAQIESDRLEINLQPTDSIHLVNDLLQTMQPQIRAKRQQLTLQAEPNLPLIWCDQVRASQILLNLVTNASKYTPEAGAIVVMIKRANAPHFVQVSVKDSGIGIPPEEAGRLFNSFFRATNARVAGISGAGLGLAIVRTLVELHGGKVWFDSTVGKGSTFHVTFPTADAS